MGSGRGEVRAARFFFPARRERVGPARSARTIISGSLTGKAEGGAPTRAGREAAVTGAEARRGGGSTAPQPVGEGDEPRCELRAEAETGEELVMGRPGQGEGGTRPSR